MASFDRSYDFPLVYHCKLFGQSVLTDLKTNLKILTIFFYKKNVVIYLLILLIVMLSCHAYTLSCLYITY